MPFCKALCKDFLCKSALLFLLSVLQTLLGAIGILNDRVFKNARKGRAEFGDIFLTKNGLFCLFLLGQALGLCFFGKEFCKR